MTEFCNGGLCRDRLKQNEKCEYHTDCEYYNCQNGVCNSPIMYYLVKRNDNEFKSKQEIVDNESYNDFYQQKDPNIEQNKKLHNFNHNCE